jgi:acyl-CoA synthetase (AMP-forming)/AMP-acid ligase II
VGTIYVRNSTQFDGYTSGTSGATKDFHGDYTSSCDVGYLDDAGRLFVVGRDDEMIVSGGENVYPIEVEKTLSAHPRVAEAAVLGVDDDQYGQRLVAFRRPDRRRLHLPGGAEGARPREPGELQGSKGHHSSRRFAEGQYGQDPSA